MFEIAVSGPNVFKRHTFNKSDIIVGSSRSNDLPLRHPFVSRQHARFFWNNGFYVQDLDSKNGTFVNGNRVHGTVALGTVDDIDIGPFTLTLVPLNRLGDGANESDVRPVTPAEQKFLSQIRAKPTDAQRRLAYADWLAARGEELKAEILRMQEKLRAFPLSIAGSGELNALLSALPKSETWWKVLLTRSPIENCGPAFATRCPKNWDALRPSEEANIRTCDVCKAQVLYALTASEAKKQVKAGGRLVMDPEIPRKGKELPRDTGKMVPAPTPPPPRRR